MNSGHGADSLRYCSGGLYIPIEYRFIYKQRLCGMSHLHLNVMCLDRWQCVCTAFTDSKSRKTWWEWSKLTWEVQYRMAVHALRWLICPSWGVPGLQWYIHNEWQLAKVSFIHIQECHSELDCRFQLCLNFNHRPGNTQQQNQQLSHEYTSRVSTLDALGCWSEVCPNFWDMPMKDAALPRISEPCHGFWHKYSILPRLFSCQNGLAIVLC